VLGRTNLLLMSSSLMIWPRFTKKN